MSFVISSVLPFPNIAWWCFVLNYETVAWDLSEHFEKMTYRNRYYLAAANGLAKLSIPIHKGRDHHAVMNDVLISYAQDWQTQHWRTIVSAYNRSPYFEFYASSLEKLFLQKFDKLIDFNLASIHWLTRQLELSFKEETISVFRKEYPAAVDLRNMKPELEERSDRDFPLYYQVFQERNGFTPNLSIIDLLFSEGPLTKKWLKENKESVVSLMKP